MTKKKQKPTQPQRYTLSVTLEQAQKISHACEVVARLSMTQLHDALDCVRDREGKAHILDHELKDKIQRMVKDAVGLHPNAHWGIRGKDEMYWEIYSTIRHRLSWDRAIAGGDVDPEKPRDWSKCWGCHFDEPMSFSGHPLPVIKGEE
jgi:hypothetical protein